MDESWYIEVGREISRGRLVQRHMASGIVPDVAAAEHRISSTDFLNADGILENRLPLQQLVPGFYGCYIGLQESMLQEFSRVHR
jgi:hypothetical protein